MKVTAKTALPASDGFSVRPATDPATFDAALFKAERLGFFAALRGLPGFAVSTQFGSSRRGGGDDKWWAQATEAVDGSGRVAGLLGKAGPRVLFLYAAELEPAAALLRAALAQEKALELVTPATSWLATAAGVEAGGRLRRFHTTRLPETKPDWALVTAAPLPFYPY